MMRMMILVEYGAKNFTLASSRDRLSANLL
jgi:hypothetical protein